MKTINRFQFAKGQESEHRLMSLEKYAEIMTTFPYQVNPKAYTLWIPFYSSNRTATVNLNHEVHDFNEEGYLVGYNGNCGTPYLIILVSPTWSDNSKKELLAKLLVNKYALTQHESCPVRAIKASRIKEIIELITETPELH